MGGCNCALLNGVGKFVGEEPLALRRLGFVASRRKEDISPNGKGLGLEIARHFSSLGIGMDTDIAKVVAHARGKEAVCSWG